MKNLTENGLLALNDIITAQSEIDVFVILDKHKVDNVEGHMLLNIFHQSNAHRQKAIKADKNARYKLKIKQLQERYEYMKDLSTFEMFTYYGHLIHEDKKSDNDPMWQLHNNEMIDKCARYRTHARMEHKAKKHSGEQAKYKFMLDAANCTKCQHLIKCNCR